MPKHTIFYKNIPVADCNSSGKLNLYNDLPAEAGEFVRVLYPRLMNFLKGNLPDGRRYGMLTRMCRKNYGVIDLAAMLDEFTCDISIDRPDRRSFSPVPSKILSNAKLENYIPDKEYDLITGKRSTVSRQISFSGYWDKFTAVLEEGPEGAVLRECDRQKEAGNVIIKVQELPYKGVNEAFCTGLAEKCGIKVPRRWTVSTPEQGGGGFVRKHYITERFGIHRGGDGCVERDIIFDIGILLGETISGIRSISSEDYFKFMRSLLSDKDMQKFLRAYLYGFIIGNCDMHVKNFSVRYTGSGYALTPIYDIASDKGLCRHEDITLPVVGKVNVASEAFAKLMLDNGLPHNDIAEMCDMVMDNIEQTAEEYFDSNCVGEGVVYDRIRKYAETRCMEMLHSRYLKKKHSKEEQYLEIS